MSAIQIMKSPTSINSRASQGDSSRAALPCRPSCRRSSCSPSRGSATATGSPRPSRRGLRSSAAPSPACQRRPPRRCSPRTSSCGAPRSGALHHRGHTDQEATLKLVSRVKAGKKSTMSLDLFVAFTAVGEHSKDAPSLHFREPKGSCLPLQMLLRGASGAQADQAFASATWEGCSPGAASLEVPR